MNVTGANSGLVHIEPLVRDRAAEGIAVGHAALGLGPSPPLKQLQPLLLPIILQLKKL
jgi:hypothetical protein